MAALVVLADVSEPAVLEAAKQSLRQLGTAVCLQPPPPTAAAGAQAGPPPRLVLGLCNLAKPPQSVKPVVQVRYRPGPFVLRDFYAAVGRLQHVGSGGSGGVSGAVAAASLGQLVGVVAQDAACATTGPNKTVMYLTDRADYEPDDFRPCLEMCRSKGVRVEMVFLLAAGDESGPGGSGSSTTEAAADALAAAWAAAEEAFPHLSVTVVPSASRVSMDGLASTLLQRYTTQPQQQVVVNLQFKQPLVGSINSLQLSCHCEIRPLAQSVQHAALCPCHRAPATWAAVAPACSITGAPLDYRQCSRDERVVQVGSQAGGALQLSAPFNIAAGSRAGAGPATLTVLSRIQVAQANPALLFGVPLMLAAPPTGSTFKVVHEGELVDLSTAQMLEVICTQLSSSQQALLAHSTIDLESSADGLFRLHYLLLPCAAAAGRPAMLCAKRLACSEELLAPLLPPAEAAGASAMPPAVVEAVAGRLGAMPLAAQLDSLTLSGRSSDMVEMLVRESQPPPLPKAVAPAAAAPAGVPAAREQLPAAAAPAVAPSAGRAAAPVAPPAAAASRGRRAVAATAAPRESGKTGRGALELKRPNRR